MGRRSQPRNNTVVPVRIFGTDSHGQVFSEKVSTVNVSRKGAQLAGVRPDLGLDEIVGLTHGTNRVHFRVKWIGEPGTPRAGQLGLLNIAPEKPLWDFPLPADAIDDYDPVPLELGKRLKVGIWFGQTKVWADARVAHRTPGMGVGLVFTQISDQDLDQIRHYLESLSPFAKKPRRVGTPR